MEKTFLEKISPYLSLVAVIFSVASLVASVFVFLSLRTTKQVTAPAGQERAAENYYETVTGELPEGVDAAIIEGGIVVGVPTGGTPQTPQVSPDSNVTSSAPADLQAEIDAIRARSAEQTQE